MVMVRSQELTFWIKYITFVFGNNILTNSRRKVIIMLNSDSQEMLQYLADEYKKRNGKDVVFDFRSRDKKNFEKHQEYKFHLEELDTLGYVNVNKEPYMTGEYWMVEVKPKAYMYLKDQQK